MKILLQELAKEVGRFDSEVSSEMPGVVALGIAGCSSAPITQGTDFHMDPAPAAV